MFHVKRHWNIKREYLMNQGINGQEQWYISSAYVIDDIHNYRDKKNDLHIICLFRFGD